MSMSSFLKTGMNLRISFGLGDGSVFLRSQEYYTAEVASVSIDPVVSFIDHLVSASAWCSIMPML